MSSIETKMPRAKWDEIWLAADDVVPGPARVLIENSHLLPQNGTALDLACGLGGNALFLARCGLTTWAWDISPVALERLHAQATRFHLVVAAEVRDAASDPPPPVSFDVILVSRFLHRPLCPALIDALKPGGLLFYQTFTRDKLSSAGPNNPDYLLGANELLRLFHALQPVVYREEGRLGDLARGFRDEAMLVARKP